MWQNLSAGDLCTRDTVFALPQTGVAEAARLMREQHVGSLVVVEESPRGRAVVGMLTDRDIVTAIVAKEVDPTLVRVGDVMSRDPLTARESDTVLDVLTAMRQRGVRRVPVVDAKGSLMGILALDDLLGVLAEQMRAVVAVIESGGSREKQRRA
ncbi:MAG: CBS domain-containing protein [Burkholderiaceae bacterium]